MAAYFHNLRFIRHEMENEKNFKLSVDSYVVVVKHGDVALRDVRHLFTDIN